MDLEEYPSVQKWLGNLSKKTQTTNLNGLKLWLRWLNENSSDYGSMTPGELIEFQKESRDYQILDEVQAWVQSLEGKSLNYKKNLYAQIHSFFKYNRAMLPRDSFKVQSTVPKTLGTLTVDELKRMILASNPMYRAIFTCIFMGGMGQSELLYWSNYGLASLQDQLERNELIIRIDLPGRKHMRNIKPFYTFIGGDALKALKVYLESRKSDVGSIFVTQYDTPLSGYALTVYWLRKLRQLGLIPQPSGDSGTRYGKNLHELRDLFRSRWQKSPADPLASEFFMGHEVDPNEYNKAFDDEAYSRRQYRRALEWLNVLSEDPESIPLDEHERQLDRIDALERRIEGMQPASDEVEILKAMLQNPEAREIFTEAIKKLQNISQNNDGS